MTTHSMSITDGTITLEMNDLTTTKTKILRYVPGVSVSGEPIRDNLTVHFFDTSSNNLANLHKLNRLLEQARNYTRTQTGPKVYVLFDPGDSGTDYRSLLYSGEVKNQEQTLRVYYTRGVFSFDIEIIRQSFWEGALTQIPLTNASATDDTAGITITNANDATAENWVSIKAADVIGDMPAPIKLQMYNSKSGADASDEIYVFHNVHSDPANLDHILEGEDATGAGITDTGDATDSGDFYASTAWTATTETLIATWAITGAELDKMDGGRFKILARWDAAFPYTNVWLRLKQETANGVLFTGEQRLIPDVRGLHELDTMRLPPESGLDDHQGINLKLYALRNESGTHTIALDYLMLGAISGDNGWKRFVSINQGATGIAYQEYFIHDAIEKKNYRTDTSADNIREFTEFGGEILLTPNVVQKLYFLTCDINGLAKVDQTWAIKLWYRPRRHSL